MSMEKNRFADLWVQLESKVDIDQRVQETLDLLSALEEDETVGNGEGDQGVVLPYSGAEPVAEMVWL